MKIRKWRAFSAAVAATVVVATAAYQTLPNASADVAGPLFATKGNASDPHIIRCVNPDDGHEGYCLYTSKDLGESGYPPRNFYPMKNTYLYYSPDGHSNWVSKGIVATEQGHYKRDGSWIANDALSQGAPAAVKWGNKYYLYVPNVADKRDPGIHETSRIATWSASSPFGPYTYHTYVTPADGYMSDPDVFIDGSTRYLLWTDGDYTNCGGLQIAMMEDYRHLYPETVQPLTVTGVEVLGDCDGNGPLERPRLAGASVYKFGETSMPGPYTLVFAANPTSVPDECDKDYGQTGSDYEVIAYATATAPQGPYTYRGVILCGSVTEITTRATIMKVDAYDGRHPWVIVYHDGPSMGNSDDDYVEPQRKLHAECLFAGGGVIAGVLRRPLDTKYGFNDCVGNGAFAFSAIRHMDGNPAKEPTLLSSQNGNADMVSRYAVGTFERYKFYEVDDDDDIYVIQALSNKAYLCTFDKSSPLRSICSESDTDQARFRLDYQADGTFTMTSMETGLYVRVASDGRLFADGKSVDLFTEMHLR
jgi:hypothetical protein